METSSQPRSDPSSQTSVTESTTPSFWSPFRHRVYRWLWLATVVANTGTWMYNAAAGWLMTSLSPSPLLVSLVQVANSLPMFLFALPAGALADIIDKRRFILALEILIAVVSAVFALLVSLDLVTPGTLLVFMFLVAFFAALEAPAWQAIVPQLVPKRDLGSAIAANSVGVNISRAIGPALAGVIITAVGIAAPFWLNAVSNVGVIGVFWWWRSRQTPPRSLPAERVTSAIRTGYRYVRNNRHMRATLARAVGFFLFASAYWALLPLVARIQLNGGPQLYGILLAAIGIGAILGAFVLPKLKATIGRERYGRGGRARHGASAGPIRLCLRADNGRFRKRHRRHLLDCGARFAERLGADCVTGLGAWSRTSDVRHCFLRDNDAGQHTLGRACQRSRFALGALGSRRRCGSSNPLDLGMEASDRARSGFDAVDALAGAGHRRRRGNRRWASPRHRAILRRSREARCISRSHR